MLNLRDGATSLEAAYKVLGITKDATDEEVKAAAREAARAQFAQYGMSNVPDEYLDNYAQDMLKKEENVQGFVDRAIDQKLIEVMKNVVKLNEKTVSLDEFNKAMAE